VVPELVRMLWRREKFLVSRNLVFVQSVAKAVFEVRLSPTSGVCQNRSMWNN
jgi:hypothetical protein